MLDQPPASAIHTPKRAVAPPRTSLRLDAPSPFPAASVCGEAGSCLRPARPIVVGLSQQGLIEAEGKTSTSGSRLDRLAPQRRALVSRVIPGVDAASMGAPVRHGRNSARTRFGQGNSTCIS